MTSETVPDRRWSTVLDGIRADALDCFQTTFALIADRAHGRGAHLALGSRLAFAVRGHQDGGPTVVASLDDRLADAQDLLGLRVTGRWTGIDGPALRALADTSAPLYVVADAHAMGWVPYAGHEHMAHSFLLSEGGGAPTAVDAYHNDTAYGPARPGTWRLTEAALDAAVAAGAEVLAVTAGPRPTLDARASLDVTAGGLREAIPEIERYVAAVRAAPMDVAALDRLVLDVWMLARARALHVAWLGSLGTNPPGLGTAARDWRAQAERWQRLAAQTYLAARRARRRLEAPDRAIGELERLLLEDVELAGRSAQLARAASGSARPGAPDVRRVVLDELRRTFAGAGEDEETGSSPRPLRDLPGFSSFRLLDVIDRIEARLEVRLDANDLTADSLRDAGTLSALFAGAARAGARQS